MEQRVVCGQGFPSAPGARVILVILKSAGGSLHIGIAYLHASDEWRFLHLGWHNQLICESLPTGASLDSKGYAWVFLELDEDAADVLCGTARNICRRNNLNGPGKTHFKLPYGFSDYHGWLSSIDGSIEAPANGVGLTCASFVLAIFENANIPLIDLQDWPVRPEDVAFQQLIVTLLSKRFPDQAAKVSREIGSKRIRPEEVAGAALHEPMPATFEQARPGAKYVLTFLGG